MWKDLKAGGSITFEEVKENWSTVQEAWPELARVTRARALQATVWETEMSF